MKVRMKVTAAGPQVHYLKGMIVDIAEAQAMMYIRGGYAEPLESAIIAPDEVATVNTEETAILATEIETASVSLKPARKPTKKGAKKKAD